MEKKLKHFLVLLFLLLTMNIAQAQLQNLTFDVRVSNFTFIDTITGLDPSITGLGNMMEFDIYIQQTNVPANDAEIMRFALGQYYININWGYNVATPTAADTAGFAKFRYIPGSTGFSNPTAVPTNPHVKPVAAPTDGGSYYPPNDITNGIRGGYLLMNSNNALGSTSDVQISGIYPGTKVGRFRLRKNVTASWPSPYFASVYSHMRWRKPPSTTPNNPTPVSKIFAYNGLGGTSTEVSNKGTWIMDTLSGQTFPVELESFTASANRNNVDLNWSTVNEINNAGFDIERSKINGQQSDNWERISFVNGNGSTLHQTNYSFTDRNLSTGKYKYRLKQIDFNGSYEYFNLSNEVVVGVPDKFELSQNYPNPFNPATNLEFGIPEPGMVSLKIYDVSGKEVATLINDVKLPGYYVFHFNASGLSSGMYFYRLILSPSDPLAAGNFISTKKMVLVK